MTGLPNSSVVVLASMMDFVVRHQTTVVLENIEAVMKMIETNRNTTYREIEVSLGICKSQIETILHVHLTVKRICSRWISHNITETKNRLV